MSESTVTLQSLRRSIGVELKMPFFRRFPNGYGEMDTSSTTSKIVDSALTQKDGFWNGSWFFNVSTGEVSLVRFFQSGDNSFSLETPLASSPSVGDDYELHEIWNAIDIRHYINKAILEGGRTWPETRVDESFVLVTDKLEYDLTTLAYRPWIISKVLIENRGNVQRGHIQSATSTTFTVESSGVFSTVTTASDWRVSIYDGTGKGQIRTLQSVAGAVGTVSSAWTTTPDSTSLYSFWDASEDIFPWIPFDQYRLDSKEYPDRLNIFRRLEAYYGMRMRIEYMSEPTKLTAENDTTSVPESYIIPKAVSFLMGQRLTDTKVDKEAYYAEYVRYNEMAEEYRKMNAPHKPDTTLKSPTQYNSIHPSGNPLDWPRR